MSCDESALDEAALSSERCPLSKIAELAEDSVVVVFSVKFEDIVDCAYDEVEDAETQSPEDFGVGVGRPFGSAVPLETGGRAMTK